MHTLHANFNGGLMTPRIGSRFDLEKLRTGCVQMENMLPTPFGGVVKRPGITLGTWLGNSSRSRAITFRRSATESSIIILGAGWGRSEAGLTTQTVAWVTARNYKVGDVVTVSSIEYYCTEAQLARRLQVTPLIGISLPMPSLARILAAIPVFIFQFLILRFRLFS